MNYETATDFELNKRLAELHFGRITVGTSYDLRSHVSVVRVGSGFRNIFDPCNNWNAIMPIAVELGVSLTSIGDGEYSAHDGFWHHGGQIFDCDNDQDGSDPKRGLVICCIKVLEAKNNG